MGLPLAAGWRCVVCGASVDIAKPFTWTCPNVTADDRHHALELVQVAAPLRSTGAPNPFVAFRPYLAWDSFAAALGLTEAARDALVIDLDHRIAVIAGTGFVTTPFLRADALSHAMGFAPRGGIWVKDETRNVAGSHKARHLFTILLHLVAAEVAGRAPWREDNDRPPLAIASCGNAALAACTLAAAVAWPIRVFVPPAASAVVVDRLRELNAEVITCPRRPTDPPGDPCVHRFREAVAAGAVPFSVQGTENAWCLDGGRTIGWEMSHDTAGTALDRVFVQVGGGAFAACVTAGLKIGGATPRFHAVQTNSSAPLDRAWRVANELGGPGGAAQHWAECMWPWEQVGVSAADGILDDETYDWLPVLQATSDSDGRPIVATEADVLNAHELAREHTSIDVSHTGTAGLAGVLAIRNDIAPDERIAVIFSGVAR
jgi:threonine synthase